MRSAPAILGLVMLVALVACGSTARQAADGGAPPTATATATTTGVPAQATASTGAATVVATSPTATVHGGTTPTATATAPVNLPPTGAITVTTDRTSYGTSATINATVTNGAAIPIYSWDTKSSCSILTLFFWSGGTWVNAAAMHVASCSLGRVAFQITIPAHGTYQTKVMAGSQIQPVQTFPPGTYRLELVYYLTPQTTGGPLPVDPTANMPTTINSASFTIS